MRANRWRSRMAAGSLSPCPRPARKAGCFDTGSVASNVEVSPSDIIDIVERSGEKSLHVARLVLIAIREVFAQGVARHVVEGNPCAHIKAKAIIGSPPKRRTRIMLTDAKLIAMLGRLPEIGRQLDLRILQAFVIMSPRGDVVA